MHRIGTVGIITGLLVLVACGEGSGRDRHRDGDDAGDAGEGQSSSGAGGARAGRGGSAGGAGKAAAQGGAGGRAGAGAGGTSAGTGNTEAGRSGENAGGGEAGRDGEGGEMAGAGAESGGAGTAGSGAGGGGGGTGGDPTVEEQFAALGETVTAFCAAARTCCAEHDVPATLDNCEASDAGDPVTLVAVESGAVTIDLAALARCRAAYQGSDPCNLNAVVAACDDVFIGNRAEDESCTGGYDCDPAGGAVACMFATGTDPTGTCKRVLHAGVDDPCDSNCRSGEGCKGMNVYGATEARSYCFEDEGLFCEYFETGSRCRPVVPLGEPCDTFDSFDACGSRARCEGICVALSDLGEECGRGCINKFLCVDGVCADPTWVGDRYCGGEVFVP